MALIFLPAGVKATSSTSKVWRCDQLRKRLADGSGDRQSWRFLPSDSRDGQQLVKAGWHGCCQLLVILGCKLQPRMKRNRKPHRSHRWRCSEVAVKRAGGSRPMLWLIHNTSTY